MFEEIKLVIFENVKVIDTVQLSTNLDPVLLMKSLEQFRQIVNEKLTQKIVDDGNLDDYNIDEEISTSEDEEVSVNCGSPKKRKT